jgi:hypothetical protein
MADGVALVARAGVAPRTRGGFGPIAAVAAIMAAALFALAGCTTVNLTPTTTPTSTPTPAHPPAPAGSGSTEGPAASASPVPRVQPPSLGFFSSIKVPDDVVPVMRLQARGVQIFRCELRPKGYLWVYRQPEAELRDPTQPDAPVVARHGVNYSFEHVDGSRLIAQIIKYDSAARADALPWLLMSARAYGDGAFSGISMVQRVDTSGGMPPAGCDAQQLDRPLRVDFSADFVFYRPRPTVP